VEWVIDCGANVGYSAVYFLNRYPDCRVIAVEPDRGNYQLLCRNLAPYGERARAVQAGVWSRPTGLVFRQEKFRDGGEWAIMVREALPGEEPQVHAVDVPTLLAMTPAGRADVLKVDVERSEKVIFAEHTEAWLDRVRNIYIELHDEECVAVFDRAAGARLSVRKEHGELTFCQFSGVE